MWCCLVTLCCVLLGCTAGVVPGKLPRYGTITNDIIEPGSKFVASKRPDKPRTLYIVLSATKYNATLHIDGKLAWWHTVVKEKSDRDPKDLYNVQERGLYVLLVHPVTGQVQGQAIATGWFLMGAGHAVRQLVRTARRHDLLLFFTVGEMGPGMADDPDMQRFMTQMGAEHFSRRSANDMYALVRVNGGPVLAEAFVANRASSSGDQRLEPASPLAVSLSVPVPSATEILCPWKKTPKSLARSKFCFKYDGYSDLCDCEKENLLPIEHQQLEHNNLTDVPIAVVAGNRPQALYRMLSSLLRNRGVTVSNIIIFVDGEHKEVEQLCSLLDVKCVSQTSDYTDVTLRIREHYRQTLTNVWRHFPAADRVIVLEEDLDVSPDFVSYFSQTSHLLDADPSLWCISAWNDHAFDSTSSDPALLYRVEYMPGLGWMMTRPVVQELLDKWPQPKQAYDWDVWVRWDSNRRERECVVPDVPRTFHFGISGRHASSFSHSMYYQYYAFNRQPDVQLRDVDSLVKDKYEEEIRRLISEAQPIKSEDFKMYGRAPSQGGDCELELTGSNKTYAFFFEMKAWEDVEMYKTVAKCFMIWDLDVRGHHHGLWRFNYFDNHVLLFGVPINMYMNDVARLFKHPVNVVQDLRFDQ